MKRQMIQQSTGWLKVANVDEEGRFGGPERRIVQVAKALKQHNVDTQVIYPKYDSEKFAQELSREDITCLALNITRLSKEKKILAKYALFFPIELLRLFSFFRKNGFDLVHVNGSYQFKVAVAAKLAGIPVVWHLNDTSMDPLVKKICTILAQYCASGFIVAGKRVREFYINGNRSLEQKPYIEIHAPVDTTVFDPNNVTPDKNIQQAPGQKIVTVAGINPTKGLEYFIEMASILVKRNHDLIFFVAGANFSSQQQYYQGLKKLISHLGLTNNIVFAGMVNNVPSFLQAADIVVFTSIAEASPTVVWEAMSMGKAIVTTDVGSVNQYIENGVSGFIVPIKDSRALSEKVSLLLDNPTLRQKMGIEARIVAQKCLDTSIAAEKHVFFYRRILSLSTG